jgi:hypothetical protein
MKKVLSAFAGLFLLISCNQTKDSAVTGDNDHMTQAKRNTEHNKEIYRAIETGDVNKLDSFIAKDVIDHEGNNGKDIKGLDSLKHHLAQIHNYFDGLKMEIITEGTSQDGNYHFSMVRMRGKAKANPWGMPVGMDMDDTSMDVVKIKDGKASEHWMFMSQKDMMEMMSGMKSGNTQPMMKDSTHR